MPFNNQSQLDPSQVQDRRGRGVGTTVAVGGGGLGLVVLVVALLLGFNPSDLGGLTEAPTTTQNPGSTSTLEQCKTVADAYNSEVFRIVGFVNSIQSFWADEFARRG
jgi:predicted metalloprotease